MYNTDNIAATFPFVILHTLIMLFSLSWPLAYISPGWDFPSCRSIFVFIFSLLLYCSFRKQLDWLPSPTGLLKEQSHWCPALSIFWAQRTKFGNDESQYNFWRRFIFFNFGGVKLKMKEGTFIVQLVPFQWPKLSKCRHQHIRLPTQRLFSKIINCAFQDTSKTSYKIQLNHNQRNIPNFMK